MVKRLLLSLLIVGGIASAFTAGAIAFFTTSETGNVTISSGTPDIALAFSNCTNAAAGTVNGSPYPITWGDVVPGDEEFDCVKVTNTGDGNLDLFTRNINFSGNTGAFLDLFEFRVQATDENWAPQSTPCGFAAANSAQYTTANGDRGCKIADELTPSDSAYFRLTSRFTDDGTDQSTHVGKSVSWDNVLSGYTD